MAFTEDRNDRRLRVDLRAVHGHDHAVGLVVDVPAVDRRRRGLAREPVDSGLDAVELGAAVRHDADRDALAQPERPWPGRWSARRACPTSASNQLPA